MATPITPAMCIGGRELTEPHLDPTGRWLAFVSRAAGPAAVSIVDLDDPAGLERTLTSVPAPSPGRGLDGGCLAWVPDGSGLIYAAVDGGLWRQPVPGGGAVCIVDGDPTRAAQAPAVAPDGSFVAYVVDQAEIWLAPLDGGDARRLDDGSHDFCLDPVVDPGSATVAWAAWSVPDMAWDGGVVVTTDLSTGDRTTHAVADAALQQPRFAPDGTPLVVHDGSGWLNVWWGDRLLVPGGEPYAHAAPSWGPGQRSYAVSPDGSQVVLARNEDGFGRLVVVDVATGAATDVARGVHGQLTWAGDRVAAVRSGARTPTQVVVYDPTTWTRRVVAVGPVTGWDEAALVEPELMTVDHDGVTLHARWYHAARRRGLLCWIHGGPTSQWPVEFLPRLAYWIDQGWDVLVPDHRGSSGHGRAYQQALHGRWGELDVADTAALLAHAQAIDDVPADRTVVVGGSSGGMAVLGLLARHRHLVAGGVASYPVTDLVELAERSHRFERHYTDTLVAPSEEVATLRSRSPMAYADDVHGPVLILHGTADPVVPVEGTIEFARRMRAAGGDVELHLFDDEGHGFRQPDNKLAEYRLMAAFLDRVVT